jgi:hypothetical protein
MDPDSDQDLDPDSDQDPDLDSNPAFFVIDLQDANKNLLLFKGTFT